MRRRWGVVRHATSATVAAAGLMLALPEAVGAGQAETAAGAERRATEPSEPDLSTMLGGVAERTGVPALAAAIVTTEGVAAVEVVGVRTSKHDTPAADDDLFHIGSCGKSMTATLAAILIADGGVRTKAGEPLTWNTTIIEAIPELAGDIESVYETVTLRQLLSHSSPLPGQGEPGFGAISPMFLRTVLPTSPIDVRRLAAANAMLNQQPAAEAGTRAAYSNDGYVVAASMLEQLTGASWEELMRTRLFEPLGMDSAGFGAPGSPAGGGDEPEQPWGHREVRGRLLPMAPTDFADNPPILGPAGRVHLSMADWARYAAFHLRGLRNEQLPNEAELLPAAMIAELHEPGVPPFALGWIRMAQPWAAGAGDPDGTLSWHNGSNTLWYAEIAIAPAGAWPAGGEGEANGDREKKSRAGVAFLCATNVPPGAGGQRAVQEVLARLAMKAAESAAAAEGNGESAAGGEDGADESPRGGG